MADLSEGLGRSGGGSAFDAMLQPSQDQLDQTIESMRQKTDAISERATKVADTVEANRVEAASLKMPELRPLPEAPTPEMRNPVEAFGSTASMLGMLGSLLTRRPLTNALNAAAGTMNAYRANDIQGAKIQFDTWKANMENAKTLHDWEMDLYKGALDKLSTNSKLAMSELEALAYATKNENLIALLQSKNTGKIYEYFEKLREQSIKMDGMMPKIEEFNTKTRLEAELLGELGDKATPQQKLDIHTRVWTPGAAAAMQNSSRRSGDNLTLNQDMDNARQHFNTLWPKNSFTGGREKIMMDGSTVPAPSFDDWVKSDWPKARDAFMKQRGAAAVSPPGGGIPPPVTSPGAAAPTATPKPAAAKVESDFIPVPKEVQGKVDGTVFRDPKGTYGKPGQYWIIRGDKAFPTAAPNAAGAPGAAPAQPGGGTGGPINVSSFPVEMRRHIATLGGDEKAIKAYLNRVDPSGSFRTGGARAAGGPFMGDVPVVAPTAVAGPTDEAAIMAETLRTAPRAAVVPGTRKTATTPTATERMTAAEQRAAEFERNPVGTYVREHGGRTGERDLRTVAAELDQRFPAPAGQPSFAELENMRRLNHDVTTLDDEGLTSKLASIQKTHERSIEITQLAEAAWKTSGAGRKAILKQLDEMWDDATVAQKVEIAKLHMRGLYSTVPDAVMQAFQRPSPANESNQAAR